MSQKRPVICHATRDVAMPCGLRAAPLRADARQRLTHPESPHLVPRHGLELEEAQLPMSKNGGRTREWTWGRTQERVQWKQGEEKEAGEPVEEKWEKEENTSSFSSFCTMVRWTVTR